MAMTDAPKRAREDEEADDESMVSITQLFALCVTRHSSAAACSTALRALANRKMPRLLMEDANCPLAVHGRGNEKGLASLPSFFHEVLVLLDIEESFVLYGINLHTRSPEKNCHLNPEFELSETSLSIHRSAVIALQPFLKQMRNFIL